MTDTASKVSHGATEAGPVLAVKEGLACRSFIIIHNPQAGRRRTRFFARIVNALKRPGVSFRIEATRGRGDATRLAQQAATDGVPVVVVAGGDGTINEAINGLTGSRAALALIPLGTANVLAAELGLPESAHALADVATGTSLRPLCLGEIAGPSGPPRRFAMMAGIGFDAHIVANLSPPLKRAAGKLAYVWQALVEWLRLRPRHYRVSADGAPFECGSLIVAKGRHYAGRFVVAPAAAVDRDSFEVILFEPLTRWNILRHALALGLGRLPQSRGVRIVRARTVTVEGDRDEPIHADGELVGTLPVRVTIARERLQVLAPPAAP